MGFDEIDATAPQPALPSTSRVHIAKHAWKLDAKPAARHARTRSLRSRILTPLASFGLVGAVIAALLAGVGGGHRARPNAAGAPHPSNGLSPLSAPAKLNTQNAPTTNEDRGTPLAAPPSRTNTTEPPVTTTTVAAPSTPMMSSHARSAVHSWTYVSPDGMTTTTVRTTPSITTITTITTMATATSGADPTPTATTVKKSTPTTTTTTTVLVTPTTTTTTIVQTVPTTTTTTTPRANAVVPTGFLQGAYGGGDNPAGIAVFDAVTGTHAALASDYLPDGGGWGAMDGSSGNGVATLAHIWASTGDALSLGVPIIPTSGGAPVGTLAAGATGAYNAYFVTLAQSLISGGEANAYLRLGWEFDGGWFAWNATTPANEANFAAYFQQIVTAMRSVPGANFKFVWNPDAGAFTTPGYNVALAYPGNAYVNDIGLDAYDQSWATPLTAANAWNVTLLPALTTAQQFAAAQGKPLAICEWGTAIRSDGHGLGDDPLYITNFLDWMKYPADDVAYESYFNANSGGVDSVLTSGSFPNALAAFKAALG